MTSSANNSNPKLKCSTLAITAALSALSTTAAMAETAHSVPFYRNADMARWSDNYVEIGVTSITGTSNTRENYKFGEFNGLYEEGTFGTLGFNQLFRSRSDDAVNLHLFGQNLGLDTYKFMLSGGKQGSWNLSASADRLTRAENDSAVFLHDGLGSSDLRLPSGYATVANANLVPANRLKPFDIQQTRDIYRLGLTGLLSGSWDYSITYREDQRTGNRLTSVYLSGFNNTMVVPYELDDKTKQLETKIAYTTKNTQAQLAYSYSSYENSLQKFDAKTPFSGVNDARLSTMPSNEFHQLRVTAAHNFSKTSRLTSTFSYGAAMQNERFLPYSLNNTNPNGIGANPSNSSLNGLIIHSLADLAFMMKPSDKSNLKLAYQYKGNDNKTPELTVNYISRDGNGPNGAGGTNIRTNVPMSVAEQKYTVDGDYEIAARTIMRALLESTRTDYSKTDRAFTNTDRLTLDLRRPVSDQFLANVGYSVAQRRGSGYNKSVFFNNSYPASQANGMTNNPNTRSPMYSDYTENRVKAGATWTATETLTLQGSVDAYQQRSQGPNCGKNTTTAAGTASIRYSDTCLGRNELEGGSANIDLQWQPDESFSTFLFYTLTQTATKQTGRTFANTAASGNESNNWYADIEYQNQTLGTGLKWQITPKWELGAQYAFNLGTGTTKVRGNGGSALLAIAEMPDDESRLHTFQLYGKWNHNSRLTFRLNYTYENLHVKDWGYDNLTATSNSVVLQTGQVSPRYSSHMIGASVALSTW